MASSSPPEGQISVRTCGPSPEDIAAMVRRVREERGWSQHQLAVRMGSTQSVIARWESGEHEVTMQNLDRIASALEVELTVRFGRKDAQ